MTDEQIGQVEGGVVLLPMTAGEIVLACNLPGVTGLKLPREVYSLIFLGEVTGWDDPRIAAANPGVTLPDTRITAVHRSDASGTTFVFTNHLSAISAAWSVKHGAATRIDRPGRTMLMRGNEGVAGRVLQTEHSIGYSDLGFASRLGLQMAALQNTAGEFVAPSIASGEAALAAGSAGLPENLRLFIADPKGAGAYPIATFSWLLIYASYPNEATRAAVVDFVRVGLTEGQALAADLGYVPLPEPEVTRALASLTAIG
jgi:phosphate transport system substrate-binding protein